MSAEIFRDRDNINTNLPIAEIPPAVKLATSLFYLDAISQQMDQRRNLRRRNEQVLREAEGYRAPFEQEMISTLLETRGLLLERGIISQNAEKAEELQVKIEKELGDNSNGQGNTAEIKGMLKEISHTVHSDTEDPVASHIFPKEEKPEIISMAIRAKNIGNLEMAEEVYLETMPRFYLEEVKSFLRQGLNFEQIVQTYPDLLPKIDKARRIAHKKLNEPPPKSLSEIMERAEEIRRETDLKARINGVGIVYFHLSKLAEYLKPQRGRLAIQIDFLADLMKGSIRNVGKADAHLVKSRKKPDERNYEKEREEKAIKQLAKEFQGLIRLVLSLESCPEEEMEQQINRFDDAISSVTHRSIDYDRALAG